jgi:hypothetical protein
MEIREDSEGNMLYFDGMNIICLRALVEVFVYESSYLIRWCG